jgi:hypothetical protein
VVGVELERRHLVCPAKIGKLVIIAKFILQEDVGRVPHDDIEEAAVREKRAKLTPPVERIDALTGTRDCREKCTVEIEVNERVATLDIPSKRGEKGAMKLQCELASRCGGFVFEEL